MPKVVDREAQRGRIRAAARRVFSEHGIAQTGLARVAEAAGMRRSSLYHYYDDKASLVRDLADELLAEEEAMFRSALEEEGSTVARVERLVSSVAQLFTPRVSLGRVLLEVWASDPRRVRRALRRIRGSLAELLREGQRRREIARGLDPEATAVLLVGLLDGLMVQVFLDPTGIEVGPTLERALARTVRRTLEA